ncbi:MAG: ABC-F family ATP-binding cassette domain-containing protein, partial [Firmicutes bacterium]|nr:ABC-F family ATP-binding cassette domain-containing protein [Bacillota bacterium]
MIILSCEKISKSFGVDVILDELTFSVAKGARMGIVGANGAGKTTLFKLITGTMPFDSGNIYKAKDLSIGYLEQNESVDSAKTVWEELLTVYSSTLEMEKKIRSLEHDISLHTNTDDPAYIELTDEYTALMDAFVERDGYIYESLMRGVLIGLGFTNLEFDQPIWQLSGGQKTRVALSKLLLRKPDLLLLDEPTNHLDLDAAQWLEGFLKDYSGTIVTISHDRYFLDRLSNCILDIENHKCMLFQGNYTDYYMKKQQLIESQEKDFLLQQKEVERQEAIIRRYRSFNREKSIKAAESRQKALDKIVLVDKPVFIEDIRMSFNAKRHSGNDVLKVNELSMSFEENSLFENISFSLEKGDRVGIIGANGTGKTTLFNLLLERMQAISGEIKYGTGVDIGYYDQEQSSLTPENTAIDELWNSFPQLTQTQIRNTLALFLFRGDDVYKNINKLSGGERGRVMLAKLMLAENNFLLLDEPTNHLDMASKEILEASLEDYSGTILVISHDRYFLNKIANRILLLEDKRITEYLGNYDDYIERKKNQTLLNILNAEVPVEKTKTSLKEERKKERDEKQKKKVFSQLLSTTEDNIKSLEERAKQLEKDLCDPKLYLD